MGKEAETMAAPSSRADQMPIGTKVHVPSSRLTVQIVVKRKILAMIALRNVCQLNKEMEFRVRIAYKLPSMNVNANANFVRRLTCNFQTCHCGNMKIIRSVVMFGTQIPI